MFSLQDALSDSAPSDQKAISTVRRINERWIVHGLLKQNSAAYLQHLEETDPQRLARTCQTVSGLIRNHRQEIEDPKALFYPALFSLATLDEVERYLAAHTFTNAVTCTLRGNYDHLKSLPPAARHAVEKMGRRIREYLAINS